MNYSGSFEFFLNLNDLRSHVKISMKEAIHVITDYGTQQQRAMKRCLWPKAAETGKIKGEN